MKNQEKNRKHTLRSILISAVVVLFFVGVMILFYTMLYHINRYNIIEIAWCSNSFIIHIYNLSRITSGMSSNEIIYLSVKFRNIGTCNTCYRISRL